MTAIEYARILEFGGNFKLSNEKVAAKVVEKKSVKENMPTVEKVLYGIYNGQNYYAFETEEERDTYYDNFTGSYITKITLGYIGSFKEKNNIVRLDEEKQKPRILSVVNTELSYCYNEETGKWSTCRTGLGNIPDKIQEIKDSKSSDEIENVKVKAI